MKELTIEYNKSRDMHIMTIMVSDHKSGYYQRGGQIFSKSYKGMWRIAKPKIDKILEENRGKKNSKG